MELSKEQKELLLTRMNEMPHKCPICNEDKFGINDIESQLISYQRQGTILGINNNVPFIPVVTSFCANCGHVDLFVSQIILREPVK